MLDVIPRLQLRGAESFAQYLEAALADRYRFRLLTLYRTDEPRRAPVGVALDVVEGTADSRRVAAGGLRERVARFEPDLLVAHGGEPLWVASRARLPRVLPLIYLRVSSVSDATRSRVRTHLLRAAYARADAIVTVSDSLRDELVRDFGVGPDRIRVIPNARPTPPVPDEAGRAELWSSLGVPTGSVVVTWVGAFASEKDPMAVVGLAQRLAAGTGAHVVMVGDGPLGAQVRAAGEKVGNLHFTGLREDGPTLVGASDVVVSTSRTEGAPAVLIEAMLAGVPIVAFDVGGISGVVPDGVAGRLLRAGDVDGMADAIAALAADPGLRRRLGEGAKGASAPFQMRVVADAFDALYQEVLGR